MAGCRLGVYGVDYGGGGEGQGGDGLAQGRDAVGEEEDLRVAGVRDTQAAHLGGAVVGHVLQVLAQGVPSAVGDPETAIQFEGVSEQIDIHTDIIKQLQEVAQQLELLRLIPTPAGQRPIPNHRNAVPHRLPLKRFPLNLPSPHIPIEEILPI